jgi:hypothetical protein
MKVTRAQQVLDYLTAAHGEWVNGTELANEVVGGSEGLKRLRELRADGHEIEERRHPDPTRTVWQYRIVPSLNDLPFHRAVEALYDEAMRDETRQTTQRPKMGCPECGSPPYGPTTATASPIYVYGQCPKGHGRQLFRIPQEEI